MSKGPSKSRTGGTRKSSAGGKTGGAALAGSGLPGSAPTVSHFLGEMTWLMTQSVLHRAMQIGDLEWLVMPALLTEQFYLFRDGDQPVGLAMWAKCTPAAAAKLERGMIEPANRLTLEEWANGTQIWLVDLIAPFANAENKQREIMMADLIAGPLAGQAFKFHITDPATGARTVRTVEADAGEKLKAVIEAVAKGGAGGQTAH